MPARRPKEILLTWGYHHIFHGKLTRADLDEISSTVHRRLARSAHEFILNTKALETTGIDEALSPPCPRRPGSNPISTKAIFWKAGCSRLFQAAPGHHHPRAFSGWSRADGALLPCQRGDARLRTGRLYSKKLQDARMRCSPIRTRRSGTTSFRMASRFTPCSRIRRSARQRGRSTGRGHDQHDAQTDKAVRRTGHLFQLMQMREPYLDGHHGEWIMPEGLRQGVSHLLGRRIQIHIHVTGDAGVDMVLDNVEANMRRNPRHDHRTVLVHFSASQKDQIDRIKRLGVIVSGNPYYVTMLADKYGKEGLGPERATTWCAWATSNVPASPTRITPICRWRPASRCS